MTIELIDKEMRQYDEKL